MASYPNPDVFVPLRRPTPPPVFRLDRSGRTFVAVPRPTRGSFVRLLVAVVVLAAVAIAAQTAIMRIQSQLANTVTVRDLAANTNATIDSGAVKYRVSLRSVSAGQTAAALPSALSGRAYVVVQVVLENTGAVGVQPGAWTLHMADDLDRFPLILPGATDATNDFIAPGQTATRTLVFDVPTANGQKVKWLYYKDGTSPQAVEFATNTGA